MRVVLDTNVLISALAYPASKPDQILSRVRRGEIDLFISPFILSEFDRVLREKFRMSREEAQDRVNVIRSMAQLVEPAELIHVITAKDDDNRILECAAAAEADFLITGDKEHLLPLESFRNIKVINPSDFLNLLTAQS